jgi:hypothetical protein
MRTGGRDMTLYPPRDKVKEVADFYEEALPGDEKIVILSESVKKKEYRITKEEDGTLTWRGERLSGYVVRAENPESQARTSSDEGRAGSENAAASPFSPLSRTLSPGLTQIKWEIQKAQVVPRDRQIVSPSFSLSQCTMRFLLKPTAVGLRKGQANFRKARGKATVCVKVEESLPPGSVRVFELWGGASANGLLYENDFGARSLSPPSEEFDMKTPRAKGDNATSASFVVSLRLRT